MTCCTSRGGIRWIGW